MNVEAERTKGRLESQVREAASIDQRMTRADQETSDLETRLLQNEAERDRLTANRGRTRKANAGSAHRAPRKNRVRDEIQARVREAEKTIEASRSVILRLLGEASTIRNQIAQADTYLAGIERERARVSKEEENSPPRRSHGSPIRTQFSETIAQRQLELQTVVSDRRATEEGLAGQAETGGRDPAEDRPASRRMLAAAGQTRIAREYSFASYLYNRIDQETAGRSGKRARGAVPSGGRAGRLHGSGPGVGARF